MHNITSLYKHHDGYRTGAVSRATADGELEALHTADAQTVLNAASARVVDGGVTATGVLSRQRGNLITIGSTR